MYSVMGFNAAQQESQGLGEELGQVCCQDRKLAKPQFESNRYVKGERGNHEANQLKAVKQCITWSSLGKTETLLIYMKAQEFPCGSVA